MMIPKNWSRLHSALLMAVLLVLLGSGAFVWGMGAQGALASPFATSDTESVVTGARHSLSLNRTESTVSVAVEPPLALQIFAPENGKVIVASEGSAETISGRAWVADDGVHPDAPVLNQVVCTEARDCTVSWSEVAGVLRYVLQESTTDTFAVYTQEEPVEAYRVYPGKAVNTYYYRVASLHMEGSVVRRSRWSNVESVTVGAGTQTLQNPTRSLMTTDLTAEAIIVDVSLDDGGTWISATVTQDSSGEWWNWSYQWTVPVGNNEQQAIHARTRYSTEGEFTQDTITVTLRNAITRIYMPLIARRWPPIPYTPVLSPITPSGGDFTVSWTYTPGSVTVVPSPIDYELQQASDSAFTQNVQNYIVTGLSRAFTNLPGGSYYFRVRARNSHGYGSWSNVQVAQLGLVYNFDSGTEGWFIARSDEDDGYQQTPRPLARNGALYHIIWGSRDESLLSPMQPGPAAPYTIEARMALIVDETINNQFYTAKSEMTFGIIFGGNPGSPCPALRTSGGCLNHYYRVLATWDQARGQWNWSLKRVDFHDDTGSGRSEGDNRNLIDWRAISGFQYNATGWNDWKIVVTNDATNNIKVYLNNNLIGQATDHRYINDRYFGTVAASPAHGAVGAKWDWFKIQ